MAHSPLEQFAIKTLIPLEIGGYDVSFTQSAAWMFAALFLGTAIMVLGMRRREMVPGRFQNIPEILYELIQNMADENIGPEGRKYFPFVFSVFMIVLMGNLLGMVPYSFTFTSHIIVTMALALIVFITATLVGIFRHGLHFFSFFAPKGLPLALMPLIIPIEIISYLSRPLSLSVRLFINMMAGHTMLKVIAGFSASLAGFSAALSILPALVNIAVIGLEFMIAFIQAYVFAILTCLYLKDAIELH